MFETNVFGTLAMIKAVLPAMVARRCGEIVNIGSVAGHVGFSGLSHYSASKFALTGMTESLAAEISELGMRVTLAELGPFATHFTSSMTFAQTSAHYDLGALSAESGECALGRWRRSQSGAEVLLDALADPSPPRRIVLGELGLDVVALHDQRRLDERKK